MTFSNEFMSTNYLKKKGGRIIAVIAWQFLVVRCAYTYVISAYRNHGRLKPKTMKLVFVVSPLSMHL